VEIVPFTREAAERAGEIYLSLRGKNQLIDFRDIFIGAAALIQNLPLITLNVNHFERIDGLKIFN
jgi:tRNA(fMet)-specific endonuclease VapC